MTRHQSTSIAWSRLQWSSNSAGLLALARSLARLKSRARVRPIYPERPLKISLARTMVMK